MCHFVRGAVVFLLAVRAGGAVFVLALPLAVRARVAGCAVAFQLAVRTWVAIHASPSRMSIAVEFYSLFVLDQPARRDVRSSYPQRAGS